MVIQFDFVALRQVCTSLPSLENVRSTLANWSLQAQSWCRLFDGEQLFMRASKRNYLTHVDQIPKQLAPDRQEVLRQWQACSEPDGEDLRQAVNAWHHHNSQALYAWPLPHPFLFLESTPTRDFFYLLNQDVSRLARRPVYLPSLLALEGRSLAACCQHFGSQALHYLPIWQKLQDLPGVWPNTFFSQYEFAHTYHQVNCLLQASNHGFSALEYNNRMLGQFVSRLTGQVGQANHLTAQQHYYLQVHRALYQQALSLLGSWRKYWRVHQRFTNGIAQLISTAGARPCGRGAESSPMEAIQQAAQRSMTGRLWGSFTRLLQTPQLNWANYVAGGQGKITEADYFHFLYPSLSAVSRMMLTCMATGESNLATMQNLIIQLER